MAGIAGEMARWIRSCWEFMMCGTPTPRARQADEDPLLWSYDLGEYGRGQFSCATVRAHNIIEDNSVVEVAGDTIFVGVFDGHGGHQCSEFLLENLVPDFSELANAARGINDQVLIDTFLQMDTNFLDRVAAEMEETPKIKSVGSCCLVGIIRNGTLFVANAGDCRVVLGRRRRCKTEAVALTRDDNARIQSVRDELKRTNPDSMIVFRKEAWRVRGILQVTKAIGDAYLKDNKFSFASGDFHLSTPLTAPAITAVPAVTRRELNCNDQFLVFASDGLWDLLSNEQVVEIVRRNPRNGIAKTLINTAVRAAGNHDGRNYQMIINREAAQRRDIHDDISVVVVFLDSRRSRVPEPVQIRGGISEPMAARINLNNFG